MTVRNTQTDNDSLAWEHLAINSPARAFLNTTCELVVHPIRFSGRMAKHGGLHEPFLFSWILMSLVILGSFPVAIAYFGVTAPSPQAVSTSVYNAHLLPSRITGFLILILPVLLFLAGCCLTAGGTLLFLAGRFFGIDRWETAVTILSYAKSGSLIPLVIIELLLSGLIGGCYVINMIDPTYASTTTRIATTSLSVGAICVLVVSVLIFFTVLVTGMIQTFGLDAASGTAAALAGITLILASTLGPVVSWHLWGLAGVAVATSSIVFVLIVLWITGWLVRPDPGPHSA